MNELQSKFAQARDHVTDCFAERDDSVRCMFEAAVARQHVFQLGVPGTGKSALARVFCLLFASAQYFELLLTRYTVPEEVFGPVSLAGLKQDEFRRITRGKLPRAVVAFLDEIWKANSAILNALLTIVNERTYDNGDGPQAIPLEMIVSASNELPESEELAALYDRFLYRLNTAPVVSFGGFQKMLESGANGAEPMLSMDELHAAQAEARALPLASNVTERLFALRGDCQAAGVFVSDRRWKACLSSMRASAWLDGDGMVGTIHMGGLKHCLWSDPSQVATIEKLVAKYAVSRGTEARAIVDALAPVLESLLKLTDDAQQRGQLPRVARELRKGRTDLENLAGLSAPGRERGQVEQEQARLAVLAQPVSVVAQKLQGLA